MFFKNLFLYFNLFCINNIFGNNFIHNRLSSYPYISGDTFRKLTDFIIDDTNQSFDPALVKKGDIVFVRTEPPVENLRKFFLEYHPKIKEKYILITHNGDDPAPGIFKDYLNDEKIFVWFGQNGDIVNHSKFICLPIGLENKRWGRNYVELIEYLNKNYINSNQENNLLYVNFNPLTSPKIREPIADYFKKIDFCSYAVATKKTLLDYCNDVCKSKFVLSPPGNGLDCHRTWEALYLNVIPVVKTSTLDSLYDGLPVLIVNDWTDITVELLEKKYIEMKSKEFKKEKLYFDYWAKLINAYQEKCKNIVL